MSIAERLAQLQEQLDAACQQAGRAPGEVTLVAVSKRKPTSDILAAHAEGQPDFGENYAQELRDKHRELQERPEAAGIRWHYIGPLQRNKVKYVVGTAALIHTVDSPRLLQAIERRAAGQADAERPAFVQDVLVQVNLAEEPQKSGVSRDELPALMEAFAEAPHVRCRGLMIIPPWDPEPEAARPLFRRLREVRDELRDRLRGGRGLRPGSAGDGAGVPPANVDPELPELSMGMSHDFPVAIQEGATLVRVGTAIFGTRE